MRELHGTLVSDVRTIVLRQANTPQVKAAFQGHAHARG